MAKYNKLEKFGIMVIVILLVIIAIGIVLVLNNRGTEKGMITEKVKETKQQISEDIQEALPKENKSEVEFSESEPAKKIEPEEYNKEIDRSKPELIF